MQEELFSFKGRMNRLKYWLYSLIPILILLLGFIPILLVAKEGGSDNVFFSLLIIVAVIFSTWISLAIQVKRWHDIDQSGWWALAGIIPYVNIIVLIILGFVKGTVGTNRFGRDPLVYNSSEDNAVKQEYPSVEVKRNEPVQSNTKSLTLLAVGPGTPPIVIFPNEEVTVGRSPNVNVKIDNKYVSGKHLVLTADSSGRVKVRDLSSSNGTYIEGKKLDPNIFHVMKAGERLLIGSEDVIYTL